MSAPAVIQVDNLGYSFGGAAIADGISFTVAAGEAFIIAGRSGCGKSTLMELCASLRQPQSGAVYWEGASIAQLTHEELSSARRRTGFIFQKHALIHNFSVFDNIALPLRYHSGLSEKEISAKVRNCMDEVGLFNVDRKFPNELSAAQSKSAALARAIVMEPVILFADEPTAGLDPYTEECVANVLNYIRDVKNVAILMTCNAMQTVRLLKAPLRILEEGALNEISIPGPGQASARQALINAFQESV